MSEIKAGDLIVVIHQCCDYESQLGEIFIVGRLNGPIYLACPMCKWEGRTVGLVRVEGSSPGCGGTPLEWVKRIPPLEELDDVKRDETIEA